MKKKKNPNEKLYPNLVKLGVSIHFEPTSHVFWDELNEALDKNNLSKEKFAEFFGSQTCPVINGVGCGYPWDIEAVLERMKTGKLTGTQLFWD